MGNQETNQGLRYDLMIKDALRGVMGRVLARVAERGLPGDHHFYITFRTGHPGVEMPAPLRRRYGGEMTIVLQHQFSGLEAGPDAFAVTLSFSETPHRLTIPYDAVVSFADPSVEFALSFETEPEAAGTEAASAETGLQGRGFQGKGLQDKGLQGKGLQGKGLQGKGLQGKKKSPRRSRIPVSGDPDKVVALDSFRKR